LGSIEVIERYKFEWKAREKKISFKDLWNECKSNSWRFTSESIASICVKYLVSEIVKGEFKLEDLEYAKLNLYAFSLLNGIGCIFGFIDKNDALKELKELELRLFDDSRWPTVQVRSPELAEIEVHIEELYNLALDPEMRWKYEKIKKIEVIREMPIWRIVRSIRQALARIMMFYIANDLEYAQKLADASSKEYTKLLNRLFEELSQAIKREGEGDKDAKEDVKKSFVKLFYSLY